MMTLKEAIQARGLKERPVRSTRYWNSRAIAKDKRVVPDLARAPATQVTINGDGEVSGRALTDWYVKEFCRINHLTAAIDKELKA